MSKILIIGIGGFIAAHLFLCLGAVWLGRVSGFLIWKNWNGF